MANTNPQLLGVGIAELYYKEDGNIFFHFYINGNPLSGAGSCLVKVELNGTQYSSFWFTANTPGYSHYNMSISVGDATAGTKHNVKVTVTKDSIVKTANSTITFPTQEDINKININFTHRETKPVSKYNTDTYNFFGYSKSYGAVRYSVDSEVTDESTVYDYNNPTLEIVNNDNAKHTIYYRYKCGSLVCSKSYVVDHTEGGSETPDYRVPYVIDKPKVTQVDNQTASISIADIDFTNFGVTETDIYNNPIRVNVTTNKDSWTYSYSSFYAHGKNGIINFEVKYSTAIKVYIYNATYPEDKSDVVSLDFVYTTPRVILLPPTAAIKTSKKSDGTIIKQGISVNRQYDENKTLNDEQYSGLFNEGTLYYIYTTDGTIPNLDNAYGKSDIDTDISGLSDCVVYIRNVFIYNDETINPTYSDSVRIVYAATNTNPFYFDYQKPLLEEHDTICSYLDVIYNNDYNYSKSLESINYVLNYFDDKYKLDATNLVNVAEDTLRRRYAGYYLDVYSDETQAINLKLSLGNNDTDEVNKDKTNLYNNYKYAVFDKGSWNYNYFRNGFDGDNKELSDSELSRACNYIYYNNETKQNEVHTITEETLKQSPLYKSDNRSVIYGKYLVTRFIFENTDADHRFKLENVTFNIQQY